MPVVWVQHSDKQPVKDSDVWQLAPELERRESEPLVHKQHSDCLEDTDHKRVLARVGVRALVVAGAETDACMRSTIHGYFTRPSDVTLVDDAHTMNDMSPGGAPTPNLSIANVNLYWQFPSAPGCTAAVFTVEDVFSKNS